MTYTVTAQKRTEQGTGASRRLRKAGRAPAVVYGWKKEPQSISVDSNALFYDLQKSDYHTNILNLDLDGQTFKVIVRAFQMHPYKPQVMHIDFQIIEPDELIRIRVPLQVLNATVSPCVKLHGGRVSQLASVIEIYAKANEIPEKLELDVSEIKAGDIVHLDALTFPEGTYSPLLRRGVNPPIVLATGKRGAATPAAGSEKA